MRCCVQPGLLPLLRDPHLHLPDHRLGDRHLLPHLGGPRPFLQGPYWRHLQGVHREELPRQQPGWQQVGFMPSPNISYIHSNHHLPSTPSLRNMMAVPACFPANVGPPCKILGNCHGAFQCLCCQSDLKQNVQMTCCPMPAFLWPRSPF